MGSFNVRSGCSAHRRWGLRLGPEEEKQAWAGPRPGSLSTTGLRSSGSCPGSARPRDRAEHGRVRSPWILLLLSLDVERNVSGQSSCQI